MFDSIIFIIVLALGLWVAWKIIKSLIKVAIIGILVILFVSIGSGYLFNKDAHAFAQDFGEEETIAVLQDEDIVTIVKVNGEDMEILDEVPEGPRVTFHTDFFNQGLPETFELEKYVPGTFDKEGMIALLTSDSKEDYKGYVFLSAIGHTLETRGTIFFYQQYKKGNVIIDPAPLSFTIADKVPSLMIIPVLFFLSF